MKKIYFLFLLTSVSLLFLNSCRKNALPCVYTRGHSDKTETRTLPSFAEIILEMDADVILTPDSIYSVTITGPWNTLDKIKLIPNSSNQLEIYSSHCINGNPTITINIHTPVMTGITLFNDVHGTISCSDTFATTNISITNEGHGNITWIGNSADLHIDHKGYGDITCIGFSVTTEIEQNGTGTIYDYGLKTRGADINTDYLSNGDMKVYVTDELKVTFGGFGDVYYKGNPAIQTTYAGGHGTVINDN